ncbi:MAG TPA: ATP-binding cassette domain-containing protein, partial [Thermoanaerobaculia bacterium]
VEMLRMGDFVDRRTDGFSSGMKQKTVILRALITDPQVLLFDEPTSGLRARPRALPHRRRGASVLARIADAEGRRLRGAGDSGGGAAALGDADVGIRRAAAG